MRRIAFLFFAFVIASFSQEAYGQYLPIGVLPMEYNPSFAGSVGNSRICANGKYSYLDDGFRLSSGSTVNDLYHNGFYASFDRFFPSIKSGIGLSAERVHESRKYKVPNFEWEHESVRTVVTAVFAPKFSIKGKYTLSPSIDFSFINQDVLYDEIFNSENTNFDLNKNGMSSRVGILFNARQYYVGYAVRIFTSSVNKTGIYFYDFYSTLQLGYTFQKEVDSKFSFTPQLAMSIHNKARYGEGITDWPSYNLSFRYDKFIIGALSKFEYTYPTGLQVGWQNNGWRLLISNDFTYNYDANVSLRYIFNHDKKSINILNNTY